MSDESQQYRWQFARSAWRPALGTGSLALAAYFLALGVADASQWRQFTDTTTGCGFAVFAFALVGGALLFGGRTK